MGEISNWIGMDWGSSNLRAWYFDREQVIDFRANKEGIKNLNGSKEFARAFAQITKGWELAQTPIIACGMIGSRNGWQEVPYVNMRRSAPFNIANLVNHLYELTPAKVRELQNILEKVHRKKTTIGKIYLIPGIAQRVKTMPEVMRGEETQLLGLCVIKKVGSYLKGSIKPKQDSHAKVTELAIVPGTHSKWVWLHGDGREKIPFFQTFMSGEIFSLFTEYSMLKHSTKLPSYSATRFIALRSLTIEKKYFLEGLAMAKSTSITENLFHIRSYDLLYGPNPVCAHYRLSGLIIGVEVENGLRKFRLQGIESSRKPKIYLIGNDTLNIWYQEALRFFGYPKNRIDLISSDQASRTGLIEIYLQLQKKQARKKYEEINI